MPKDYTWRILLKGFGSRDDLCKTVDVTVSCTVRSLMERMGKTLFFRSGGEPLILSEEQREFRKNGKLVSYT